jgi:type II secretory pathway pseudopilin PulG
MTGVREVGGRSRPVVRRGFTLTEIVVVIWGLGICLLIGGALIVTTMKANRAGEAAMNRLSVREALANQFRADVARAETAPERLGDLTAGPACLLLQTPRGSSVVYCWQDDKLERIDRDGDGREMLQRVPVGPTVTAIEFIRSGGKAALITLRISEVSGRGPTRRAELSAALGGEQR